MRTLLFVAVLISLFGCYPPESGTRYPAPPVTVWHDDVRSVTCWLGAAGYKGSISCLPDREIETGK